MRPNVANLWIYRTQFGQVSLKIICQAPSDRPKWGLTKRICSDDAGALNARTSACHRAMANGFIRGKLFGCVSIIGADRLPFFFRQKFGPKFWFLYKFPWISYRSPSHTANSNSHPPCSVLTFWFPFFFFLPKFQIKHHPLLKKLSTKICQYAYGPLDRSAARSIRSDLTERSEGRTERSNGGN